MMVGRKTSSSEPTPRPQTQTAVAVAQSNELVVDELTKSFGGTRVFSSLTFSVKPGELVAIVGPSGCGKTTLLECICGLITPDSGDVKVQQAALMPQRDSLLPWFDALGNAALALRAKGVRRQQARSAARAYFEDFGLNGFERARSWQLSGGMRQRVAFLRTLLSGMPTLCLDEPFGALDAVTRVQMQQWLTAALAREPRTVVLVTHDVEEAIVLADRIILLSARPARILEAVPVALSRPRFITDQAVISLRAHALQVLSAAMTQQ